jgi:hypothetical protein
VTQDIPCQRFQSGRIEDPRLGRKDRCRAADEVGVNAAVGVAHRSIAYLCSGGRFTLGHAASGAL